MGKARIGKREEDEKVKGVTRREYETFHAVALFTRSLFSSVVIRIAQTSIARGAPCLKNARTTCGIEVRSDLMNHVKIRFITAVIAKIAGRGIFAGLWRPLRSNGSSTAVMLTAAWSAVGSHWALQLAGGLRAAMSGFFKLYARYE